LDTPSHNVVSTANLRKRFHLSQVSPTVVWIPVNINWWSRKPPRAAVGGALRFFLNDVYSTANIL